MKDVSALMDGELERKRVRSTIARLEGQDDLRDAWSTFHLIRDALQGNAVGPSRFTERFHERLEQEPVPTVPRWRARLPRMRTMVTVAALAALVVAGAGAWLATSGTMTAPRGLDAQPGPFVDGGLSDPVAIEFAMAHRQLDPAFVAAPGVSSPGRGTAGTDAPAPGSIAR
jgi:hypothetical protein